MGVVVVLASLALATVAAAQQPNEDASPVEPDAQPSATLSDAQLDRMLERLAAGESTGLIGLNSYVVVVGQVPEIPLLGRDPDLGTESARFGPPSHAEMLAIVRPPTATQAAGADTLGIATATAFAVLAPMAVKAVAGWLGGDDDDESEAARFAAYTRTVQVGGGPEGASSVPFYRTGEQLVVFSMRVAESYTDGVEVEVNGQPLGLFDHSVNDIRVPDELLTNDTDHGIHLLTALTASGVVLEQPVEVEVVVVVYAAEG